jgi:hypothetical protein
MKAPWLRGARYLAVVTACFAMVSLAACDGDKGSTGDTGTQGEPGEPGEPGDPGASSGALIGTVNNALTGLPLPGVVVLIEPGGGSETTDGSGTYSTELPIGVYTVTVMEDLYEPAKESASVVAGQTVAQDITLEPVAPVVVEVRVEGVPQPGETLTAAATVTVLDGSEVESVTWVQTAGTEASLGSPTGPTTSVSLASLDSYKDGLIQILEEPPIGEEQLPPNVEIPEGEFHGGLQDRFQVVGLNPFSLEEAALVALEAVVVTSSGEYVEESEIHTEIPWKTSPGLRNVPLGRVVLLHGKDQAAYDWSLTPPEGSSATLEDATAQNPEFTPDAAGTYIVTVTDSVQEPPEQVTLEIYSGAWEGVITGQDEDGRPLAANCTGCHNNMIAPDNFTPWAQTGHAEIFTNNLDTNTHYSTNCLQCHSVGYDTEVDNGGFDDAPGYEGFLMDFTTDGVHFIADPANWTAMLLDFPEVAQLGNAQCENCHGPQNGGAHRQQESNPAIGNARTDLSADVCAQCHGEPLRHARFQQWQLSGHANYELAIDEGESGSCSRCHTGNGFLTWLPILQGEVPGNPFDDIEVVWTPDEVHPQTCATCHDPHSVGTTTGVTTDVTVRVYGNTPLLLAGFQMVGVGNGAICMTCHNSRRGPRNDNTWPATVEAGDMARAPHGSAQTDLLAGENAYLIPVGRRGNHSFIDDTCVNCHMEQTPPPEVLSYNLGGTNHTFAARDDICSNCHGDAFVASGVQEATHATLDKLQGLVEEAILTVITMQTTAGNAVALSDDVSITDASTITDIVLGESRGRQAITVSLTDGETVGPVGLNSVDVVADGGDGEVLGELYDFADERVPKAGWNWGLVYNDGSGGIHNPSFANNALGAAIDALNQLSLEQGTIPPPS